MNETLISIIGVSVGALITGVAMVLNSYFSAKFREEHEDKKQHRDLLTKDIEETQKFYERVLHLADKLIRNEGSAETSELEEFYRTEIRLRLISDQKILNKFLELKKGIADFAHKLPKMPEEFVPKFEDDDHRRWRLEERKKAKQKRAKAAKKFLPDLYKTHSELADLMKNHLKKMKESSQKRG